MRVFNNTLFPNCTIFVFCRLAVRRLIHASIPAGRRDRRLSSAIMCIWPSLRLPMTVLNYLLFLELGSIQGGSLDSLYPPIYRSSVDVSDGLVTSPAMKEYFQDMKKWSDYRLRSSSLE